MLLRYLKQVKLNKITPEKQSNGQFINSYTLVDNYNVQVQELSSEVDAQVYGSDINKMLRLKSPNGKLESFLYNKLNNSEDNTSKYVIVFNGAKHKIVAVNPYKVDIERL